MTVRLLDVCQAAGLEPILGWKGPGERAFGFRIAGCAVAVWQGVDPVGRPMVYMKGVVRRPRSIDQIEASMYPEVDTHEQGVALLAYYLASHWEDEPRPQWALNGERWADHLPWRLDQARYAGRPQARVQRDRIRLDHQALRALAETAGPEDVATFGFDGEILRIRAGDVKVALMADGEPWPETVEVPLAPLRHLPKRIMQDPLPIDIWEGCLRLGTLRVPLAAHGDGGDAG